MDGTSALHTSWSAYEKTLASWILRSGLVSLPTSVEMSDSKFRKFDFQVQKDTEKAQKLKQELGLWTAMMFITDSWVMILLLSFVSTFKERLATKQLDFH